MNLKKQLLWCLLALGAVSCDKTASDASFDVIPLPYEVILSAEAEPFALSRSTVIAYPAGDKVLERQAEMLAGYIEENAGFRPSVKSGGKGGIVLETTLENENPEAYTLTVTADGIRINGATPAGSFYGVQTLRKAIPVAKVDKVNIPAAELTDMPRFAYRGAHLDVVRHFFPADSVKEFIDMLALHNINNFHWHLTDHQGWRPEIKSRPKLTEIGSKRPHTIVGKSADEYDDVPVEGFYTREQLEDIVAYAAERNINIIPEIDLPGHFMAGLASYPELGCTGGPYEVYCAWDLSPKDVLCAGKPEVYDFLDDVFGELVEIFPSPVFHIGGDECPKDMWMKCGRCQALADSLGYVNDEVGTREAKLQNHVMAHVAKFLASKGRRVIGWDEVLDSDFDKDAIVMSWRGEDGGIKGARLGHDVIMTPARYLYFDFYQSTDQENEPLAIGGYVPVEKVYGYEPVPDVLTPEEGSHILGAQANLWTEYVPTFSQVQYMELPRMAALSEMQWSQPEKKDFGGFVRRLSAMLDIYNAHGWRYASHVFDVRGDISADPDERKVKVALYTYDGAPIVYTTDGSEPNLDSPVYADTLGFDTPVELRAAAVRDGKAGRIYDAALRFSKASFHPVAVSPNPHPRYTYTGPQMLTDACLATPGYTDENWMGFLTPELEITVDMETPVEMSGIELRRLINTEAMIFDVSGVEAAVSNDGTTYTTVLKQDVPELTSNTLRIAQDRYDFDPRTARYIRVKLRSGKIGDWHRSKGGQSFIFLDEIGVY